MLNQCFFELPDEQQEILLKKEVLRGKNIACKEEEVMSKVPVCKNPVAYKDQVHDPGFNIFANPEKVE